MSEFFFFFIQSIYHICLPMCLLVSAQK